MKQNDFYEVNGCTEFVPVTISEVYDDEVIVKVNNAKRNCMLAVEEVYLFPKVVIPKFVAMWIDKHKNGKKKYRLSHALEHIFDDTELGLYIKQQEGDYTEIIARAWLDGYTVEKEKLYTVEIPNPNLNAHVVLQKTGNGLVLVTVGNTGWAEWESSKLTEAEIKKDFERLWQFAKEVE